MLNTDSIEISLSLLVTMRNNVLTINEADEKLKVVPQDLAEFVNKIIDEERENSDSPEWQIDNYCSPLKVIATTNSPKGGVEAIEKQKSDLISLDIEIPPMNGNEMLEATVTKFELKLRRNDANGESKQDFSYQQRYRKRLAITTAE